MCVPTVAIAIGGFYIGRRALGRTTHLLTRILVLFLGCIIAIPGFLYTFYYLHFLDSAKWFYDMRSIPYSEILASGIGPIAGMILSLLPDRRLFSITSNAILLALMIFWLLVPYLKTILEPAQLHCFRDQWRDDVCLQSSSSSCGPASAATLLKYLGCHVSERTLARESFTAMSGTENWYLARALRKRGFTVEYVIKKPPVDSLPYPAVAGTRIGGPRGVGHFIAVIGEDDTHYIVGDPLQGRRLLSKVSFSEEYYFTGFFMHVWLRTDRPH